MPETEDFTRLARREPDNNACVIDVTKAKTGQVDVATNKVESLFFSIPPTPTYIHKMDDGWWNIHYPGPAEDDTSHLDLEYKAISGIIIGAVCFFLLLAGIAAFPWDNDQAVSNIIDRAAEAAIK